MGKKINVLAELLKCALFGNVIDEQVKRLISENTRAIYDMAMRHDLAHLVEYALGKSGIVVSDENLSYELMKQKAMSVMRYENISLVQKQLSELFEMEKIPFVLLKGAVIRDFYPEPWMRTSCDIDVLVKKDDLERAKKAAVENLGFTADNEWHYHDISLFSDTSVHIELHFSIMENMDNLDILLEKVWDYAAPKKEGSFEYVLSAEFFMFQTIAHMSYHFVGGGCGIRSFVDLFLLERKFSFDRKKLLDMLEETGIKTFYDACVRYAEVWFTEREHDEVTRLMHSYLLGGGTYGSKNNAIAIKRKNNSKLEYAIERIFMPYEQLIITYPSLKGKQFLTPLYQIIRWCRAVSKRRIGKTAKSLLESQNVTEEKIDDLEKLLQKIGLKK